MNVITTYKLIYDWGAPMMGAEINVH